MSEAPDDQQAIRKRIDEKLARLDSLREPPVAAYDTDDPDASELARIQVRGSDDDEKTHANLAKWERLVGKDARANGGLVPPKSSRRSPAPIARLIEDAVPPCPPPRDTESELNGLIAECRYLMREIAFNSARLTYDPDDRIRFLTSAQGLAKTAAKVGDTVARLRTGGASTVETHRHELIYRHEHTPPSPLSVADSEKQ